MVLKFTKSTCMKIATDKINDFGLKFLQFCVPRILLRKKKGLFIVT